MLLGQLMPAWKDRKYSAYIFQYHYINFPGKDWQNLLSQISLWFVTNFYYIWDTNRIQKQYRIICSITSAEEVFLSAEAYISFRKTVIKHVQIHMPIKSTWVVIEGEVPTFSLMNKFYTIICKNELDIVLSLSFAILK